MQLKDYRMPNNSKIMKFIKADWALFEEDLRCFGLLTTKTSGNTALRRLFIWICMVCFAVSNNQN